ncbi:hypothetical protein CT0861_01134 [Colletotrichum tofieldiae]|uniref:Uncharacterized protein n=1 Tax=Colletotrichum tofieldiae TaxID=708197 RepID=A0A166LKG4_9PEZI|nr:hypothetical protein CT0861_01134 [Colletotrichum tofieldiae]
MLQPNIITTPSGDRRKTTGKTFWPKTPTSRKQQEPSSKIPQLKRANGLMTEGAREQAKELFSVLFPPLSSIIKDEGNDHKDR